MTRFALLIEEKKSIRSLNLSRPPPPPPLPSLTAPLHTARKNSPTTSIELSNGVKIDFVPWELEPSHKKLAEASFVKKKDEAPPAKKSGAENEGSEKKEKKRKTTLLRCRVYEARLRRGTTTLWHSHDRDTAYVVCGGDGEEEESGEGGKTEAAAAAVVGNETAVDGAASLRDLTLRTGQAFCFLAGGRPFVHRLSFPGDSERAGAHIVGVEVSEEEEEEEEDGEDGGEEGGGEEEGERRKEDHHQEATPSTSSSSSSSSYSPLPPCYELVQKSKYFDFYKLKLPARGGTTGRKRRFPPEGATAAVVVAVRPSKDTPLSVSSSLSSSSKWNSLASHGGAFAVFQGEESEELELRNDAEVDFEAAVVVLL